jgi:hypothetical protein
MEVHNTVMAEYSVRREQLKQQLVALDEFRARTHPKELAGIVHAKCLEI